MAFTQFSEELVSAGKLFRAKWRSAVPLMLFSVVPLLFLIPYVAEQTSFVIVGAQELSSLFSMILALIGLVAFVVMSLIVKAAMFTLFANRHVATAQDALRRGARRFPHLLWTELLVGIILSILTAPTILLNRWYGLARGTSGLDFVSQSSMDTLALFGMGLFFLPALIAGIWLSFASIATILGHAGAGIASIEYSFALVRGRWLRIFKRMLAWALLTIVLTASVSPLPIASWLVPFLLTILSVAYMVVLYREAGGGTRG